MDITKDQKSFKMMFLMLNIYKADIKIFAQ